MRFCSLLLNTFLTLVEKELFFLLGYLSKIKKVTIQILSKSEL